MIQWKKGALIRLKQATLSGYGGRMVRLSGIGSPLYHRLRVEFSLCPEPKHSGNLLYDLAFHHQVMVIVNGGKTPRLSRLCKKGASVDDDKAE
jgi:hypothetical protein